MAFKPNCNFSLWGSLCCWIQSFLLVIFAECTHTFCLYGIFRHSDILLISCSGSLWFVSTEVFRSVSVTKDRFQSNLSNLLLKVVISLEEVVLLSHISIIEVGCVICGHSVWMIRHGLFFLSSVQYFCIESEVTWLTLSVCYQHVSRSHGQFGLKIAVHNTVHKSAWFLATFPPAAPSGRIFPVQWWQWK